MANEFSLSEKVRETEIDYGVSVPILGILGSELLLISGFTVAGLGGYTITLVATTLFPIRWDSDVTSRVLALIPLFRLVSLGMPVFFEFTLYSLPLLYIPILPALYLVSRTITTTRFFPPFSRQSLALGALLLVVSLFLAQIEYQILTPEPLVREGVATDFVILAVVMLLVVALVEEWLFRGLVQPMLVDRQGVIVGILVTSGLFALMHATMVPAAEVVFAFVVGLVFGAVSYRTQSLLFVILAHGIINILLYGVIPVFGPLL